MKKPIPDEHLVLKTTFEGLIQKCLAVATDPVSQPHSSSDLCKIHTILDLLYSYLFFVTANKEET